MSIKSFSLRMVVLTLVGFAIGLGGMFWHQKTSSPRHPASLVKTFKPSPLPLGKHLAAMSIEVLGPEKISEDPEESVELVGYITPNLENGLSIHYKWNLPEGVILLKGPAEDDLQNAQIGQPFKVQITVKGFSSSKQSLISLSGSIQKNGSELGASAVLTSRPEDTFENRVMLIDELRKAQEAASKEN